MRGSLFLEIPVWPHKPLRCCPIASPPNGTTKKADRDIRPRERPNPPPRRLSRQLEDALSALRRGHGGASSNPTSFQITLQYQCLSRGGERGIRTLEPHFCSYSLSRGAPSATRPSLRRRETLGFLGFRLCPVKPDMRLGAKGCTNIPNAPGGARRAWPSKCGPEPP